MKYIFLFASLLLIFVSCQKEDAIFTSKSYSAEFILKFEKGVDLSESRTYSGELKLFNGITNDLLNTIELVIEPVEGDSTGENYRVVGAIEAPNDSLRVEVLADLAGEEYEGETTFTLGEGMESTIYVEMVSTTVENTIECYILSPQTGSSYIVGEGVYIESEVFDRDSTSSIISVEYYINDQSIGITSEAPYNYFWNTEPYVVGSYELKLIAKNSKDQEKSASVNVSLTTASNNPPVCNIESPADSTAFTIGESVMIYCTASDSDGSISNLVFYADGAVVDTVYAEPYQVYWNTTGQIAGNKEIRVVAKDDQGATSEGTVTVILTQATNIPPTVAIESPGEGESFTIGESIMIYSVASDSDGSIANLVVYADGAVVDTVYAEPYQVYWNTTGQTSGSKEIRVVAEDNLGATSEDIVNIELQNLIDNGIFYGDFGLTALTYTELSDWDQIVQNVFGSEYRVADWNDLKNYYSAGNDLLELYNNLGLIEYDTRAYLELNGVPNFNDSRYYIASRHEHNPPGDYLAHDNIDDYLISLGSWMGNNQILAIKIDNNIPGMIFVEGGTFQMGDHFGEGLASELPVHDVTLSDFYIGKYEVTQEEWQTVMTGNTNGISTTPSNFLGLNLPVEQVSWYDVIVFCNRRSIQEGLMPCYTILGEYNPDLWGAVPTSTDSTWNGIVCNIFAEGYRLPTEAEWEYAARGGIHHIDDLRYAGCHEGSELANYAWYGSNSGSQTHDVGTKLPNQLGIYDMSGNVWECCWDWYGGNYYSSSPNNNPLGPDIGTDRVVRGGSWFNDASRSRVAARDDDTPDYKYSNSGFRLAKASN
ncbi:MAG: SUMF1/EgtB/PvdO family nonheme iron enzyme [Candidatus Delongbacteria bacterium]|nr:SUMF1/EgtB/PvdO family nonheme iron enzyme [Candidatus Delongbacteria bacterium]MBN2835597.1 SUMF1/EgtB/PvdO family nonheme iron enzyme [Candidatus Delongbacteria bacterium]